MTPTTALNAVHVATAALVDAIEKGSHDLATLSALCDAVYHAAGQLSEACRVAASAAVDR